MEASVGARTVHLYVAELAPWLREAARDAANALGGRFEGKITFQVEVLGRIWTTSMTAVFADLPPCSMAPTLWLKRDAL